MEIKNQFTYRKEESKSIVIASPTRSLAGAAISTSKIASPSVRNDELKGVLLGDFIHSRHCEFINEEIGC